MIVVAILRNATAFEYLEEYPVGILAELETQAGRNAPEGLFVVVMEYGRNFSGADKDVFYYNRAVGEAQHAWQSNFLHPVIYYYKRLPTGKALFRCEASVQPVCVLNPHLGKINSGGSLTCKESSLVGGSTKA